MERTAILATMGELICERAGVLNLGIEGIMVAGAFAGWVAVYAGLPLWWGVAVAMLVGMAFGLVHGVLTVPFGLSQHVVGLGITMLLACGGCGEAGGGAGAAAARGRIFFCYFVN